MINKKLVLFSICSFLLFSCTNKKVNTAVVINNVIFTTLLECNGKLSTLKIINDTSSNLILSISDPLKNYIEGINGCGNCSVTDTFYRKIHLSKNSNCSEYAINSYVNGSTFGAEYLFILWNDSIEWNITRTPFHRFEIRDINEDGIDEIIDYTTTKNGIPYTFNNGNIIRL
jgi:hypothetical protein